VQPFRCEFFGPGTAGFIGECCWPECHDQAEWMEMRSGPRRKKLWSYCNKHAEKRRKEIKKLEERNRVAELEQILEHVCETCPQCGSTLVSCEPVAERFQYGPGDDAPWIRCEVPIYQCNNACTGTHGEEPFRWVDWKGEAIKHAAVIEALLRARNAALEDHRRKLRTACELALFGVAGDADTNEGTVDRAGIAQTMEIVLEQTK
jgi:hypothetical protein